MGGMGEKPLRGTNTSRFVCNCASNPRVVPPCRRGTQGPTRIQKPRILLTSASKVPGSDPCLQVPGSCQQGPRDPRIRSQMRECQQGPRDPGTQGPEELKAGDSRWQQGPKDPGTQRPTSKQQQMLAGTQGPAGTRRDPAYTGPPIPQKL